MTVSGHAPLLALVAEILRETAMDIETLGERLCGDQAVMDRHLVALQAIDVIAQRQAALAGFLEDQCRHEALDAITLESLQQRLRLRAA